MKYLKVRWRHQIVTEPVILLSELDDERYEVRKVEIFSDGRMGFASEREASAETILGEKPLPPDTEIASDPCFIVEPLTAEAFEIAWADALVRYG